MATVAQPGELAERVQALSAQVDALSDVRARTLAQDLLAAVMAMYGEGLERILEAISRSREAGATILDQLGQDGTVASLLLIHDLYPVPLHDRVLEALDTVRPYMESHGGNVELVSLQEGVAKLALQGSCNGCAASRATLELAIKQALEEHAPDLAGLEVEGVSERPAQPLAGTALPMAATEAVAGPGPAGRNAGGSGRVELPLVLSGPSPDPQRRAPAVDSPPPRWVALDGSARPAPAGLAGVTVDGTMLVLADVRGRLLAYVDECASCGASFEGASLRDGMLRCPACEIEFDLPRAGRAAGGEPLQLHPVPLLEAGGVRVAL